MNKVHFTDRVRKFTRPTMTFHEIYHQRLDSAVWTLVFGWPQLGLISPVRFPSWSRYILGSGVELN